jgi:cold shock CspA family protein
MTGRVSYLQSSRGFGFLRTDSGERIFFAANDLQNIRFDQLRPGDPLTFERGSDRSGRPCAINVWLGRWNQSADEHNTVEEF